MGRPVRGGVRSHAHGGGRARRGVARSARVDPAPVGVGVALGRRDRRRPRERDREETSMRMRFRAVAGLLALGLVGLACTSGGSGTPNGEGDGSPSVVVPTSPEAAPPPRNGPGSAQAALEKLCTLPRPNLDGGSGV